MNILTDTLPSLVKINGVPTKINTDFRVCLKVLIAFEDQELTAMEKQMVLLHLMYPEPINDFTEAYRVAVKFLDGGKNRSEDDGDSGNNEPRVFSWTKDANLIYSAFRQTHGIDLSTANLHWWQFVALFMDLGADAAFCQLVNLRKRVKTGKATKEERSLALEMGESFEIPEPDTRTLEEKEIEERFFAQLKKEA